MKPAPAVPGEGPLVELTGIARRFPIGPETVELLADVTLRLDRGEMTALTGPSGSGKSRLLKIIGLLDAPDDGEYRFDGRPILRASDDERTRVRNRRIGFIFQHTPMLARLTAEENVALPLRYRGINPPAALAPARAMLARLGLADFARLHPRQLSGGQVQAVGIARALVGAPDLILADEPTASLDDALAQAVLDHLLELHRAGTTILVATHDSTLAARCGRHLAIVNGRVEAFPAAPVPTAVGVAG